jgi:hypothetical protein
MAEPRVPCPVCTVPIARQRRRCPRCGAKDPFGLAKRRERWLRPAGLALLVVAAGAVAFLLGWLVIGPLLRELL